MSTFAQNFADEAKRKVMAQAAQGAEAKLADVGETMSAPTGADESSSENAEILRSLGLERRDDPGSGFNAAAGATDSDKTKASPLFGKGYMSNDDFERLKNDKTFQDLYMEKGGSKSERIKAGEFDWDEMSINHMDSFLDQYGGELKELGGGEAEPMKLSRKAAEAKAFNRTYTDERKDGTQSKRLFGMFTGDEPGKSFADKYKKNVKKYLEPGYSFSEGTAQDQRDRENYRFDVRAKRRG